MVPYLNGKLFTYSKRDNHNETLLFEHTRHRLRSLLHVFRSGEHNLSSLPGAGSRISLDTGIHLLLHGRHRSGHRSHLRPDKKQRRYFHADWPHRQDPGKADGLCDRPLHRAYHSDTTHGSLRPRNAGPASYRQRLPYRHHGHILRHRIGADHQGISCSGYPGKIPDAPALHRTAAPDNIRYRFTFRRHRFRA